MKQNKTLSRIFVVLLAAAMVLMMTGCREVTSNFMHNGWDYEVDGQKLEPGIDESYSSSVTPANGRAADPSAYGSYAGPVAGGATGGATAGTAASGAKVATGRKVTASGAKAGAKTGKAAAKTSYTDAEALELYKTAANKVKTTAKSATRNTETIKTIKGSIPSMYSSFGFKEGTKTEKVVAKGASELKAKFPVEKKSYTCDLSASDIVSAKVQTNGSNKIVTIVVKDDKPNTYSNSSKCVSTISIPIGKWTCKGVTLRGTIDGNGRLTSLYYNMPTYVSQGSDEFAFSLEQNWSVAY